MSDSVSRKYSGGRANRGERREEAKAGCEVWAQMEAVHGGRE